MKKLFTTLLALVISAAIMMPLSAHAATTYVLNARSKIFHRPTCVSVKKMSYENRIDTDQSYDEVTSMGYSPCHNCTPGPIYTTTTTTTTVTPITEVVSEPATVTRSVSVQAAAPGITPQQAVEQAFAMYIQGGLDQNTALSRVQAKTAEIVSNPTNIAAIVQADLAALRGAASAAATALTPEQIVQQAFAQYVAAGMTQDQALAAVQANLPALLAQGR